MNRTALEHKDLFCLQTNDQYRAGTLTLSSKLQYTVNKHVLSEGEIISIQTDNGFIETSIHFSLQNIYSAIGLEIGIGQMIIYEADL